MEIGTVKFFDSRDNKRFGFIAVDGGGEIFFHFNDGENIEASGDEPRFCGGKLNREPKKGDVVVFERKSGYKGAKAAPWGFERNHRRAETESDARQAIGQMMEVIRSVESGDKLKLVFANKTFSGDLKGRVYMILAMHGRAIQFGELPMMTLMAVADSGKWEGFRTYTIAVLDEFDPEYFISRTIGREMLESISRVE